jgi:acyl dehydratase
MLQPVKCKLLRIERPAGLRPHVGHTLGTSDWITVDQAMIDRFAGATGDHQWIHVDVDRARREMPDGKTIAHGFLLLALIPRLAATIYLIAGKSRSVNYGLNKVRFISPVPAGGRIRLKLGLKATETVEGGERLFFESTIELDGATRPALVAETIAIAYD